MTTRPTTTPDAAAQRAADLDDVHRLGFSHLPMAQQRRIMATLPGEQVADALAASPRFKRDEWIGVNSPRYPGRWQVKKVNPTTYALTPEAGGRGLRIPHDMACAAPEPAEARPATPGDTAPGGVLIEDVPIGQPHAPDRHLNCGQIVRYLGTQTRGGITPGGLAVVLVDKSSPGRDQINIAKIGGHEDRYMICKNRDALQVVDPASLGL
jgi:hypothetical protein